MRRGGGGGFVYVFLRIRSRSRRFHAKASPGAAAIGGAKARRVRIGAPFPARGGALRAEPRDMDAPHPATEPRAPDAPHPATEPRDTDAPHPHRTDPTTEPVRPMDIPHTHAHPACPRKDPWAVASIRFAEKPAASEPIPQRGSMR